MVDAAHDPIAPDPGRVDHCVVFRRVPLEQYEALLAARGEDRAPSMVYLRGTLWIMSPSPEHESMSRMIDKLLTAYAEERGLDLRAYGSWTVRGADRGAEADECYTLGESARSVPDLAIEVVWTSDVGAKLEVWRGLGVPEVWIWKDGRIAVHVLRDDRYEQHEQSALLADLDLALVARLVPRPDQIAAVRELRAALRSS
ncbi:MAG: Uma2 family endonuclease [Myxococcota bacterium]|nr:Uma2 family endonuclease [Myxococcota bacterium]